MSENPVIDRLKDIRNRAGLTVRAIAHLMDMSSSGYSHYENPARFKDAFLPMDIARKIAAITAPRGIDPAEVMALAGLSAPLPTDGPDHRAGFREADATPFLGAPGHEADFARLITQLAPRTTNSGSYRISRDMLGIGLLAGDVVVVDRRAAPKPGELALGNARSPNGEMVAVIGRVFGDMLITMESLTTGATLDLNSSEVAVYHPIVAQFRMF